jgi:tetratricopeptide (TPR) repeat protein
MKGAKDTVIIQWAGIIARELGDHNLAIKYYNELKELSKDPLIYRQLKDDYMSIGDTVSAAQTLEEAFSIFPDSMEVVINLVDLKLKTNKIEDGISIIDRAISKNPTYGVLYYWKGRLITRNSKENWIDKALETYNKAIELSPDFPYSYFDIGFIHFLVGQEYFTRAGEEKDLSVRDALNKEGITNYNKALPMFTKAVDLSKGDKVILRESYDTMKRIYYKLQMMDKYNEANEKLKTL